MPKLVSSKAFTNARVLMSIGKNIHFTFRMIAHIRRKCSWRHEHWQIFFLPFRMIHAYAQTRVFKSIHQCSCPHEHWQKHSFYIQNDFTHTPEMLVETRALANILFTIQNDFTHTPTLVSSKAFTNTPVLMSIGKNIYF